MSYNPNKHGRADYGSFMQLTASETANLVEGVDTLPLTAQKFAHLTYQVNSIPVIISGGITLGAVIIEDLAGHKVDVTTDGELYVFDSNVATAIGVLSGAVVDFDDDVLTAIGVLSGAVNNVETAISILSGAVDNLASHSHTQLLRVVGDFQYNMKALPSSGTITSGDPVWQISRIYTDLSGNIDCMYADGNDNFDNAASAYLSLNYSL